MIIIQVINKVFLVFSPEKISLDTIRSQYLHLLEEIRLLEQ